MVQWLTGLTWRTLKVHYQLVPLLLSLGGGTALATGYLLRLATKNPDVMWDRKNNPYPWQAYENKQYKFYTENIDYSKLKKDPERPVF